MTPNVAHFTFVPEIEQPTDGWLIVAPGEIRKRVWNALVVFEKADIVKTKEETTRTSILVQPHKGHSNHDAYVIAVVCLYWALEERNLMDFWTTNSGKQLSSISISSQELIGLPDGAQIITSDHFSAALETISRYLMEHRISISLGRLSSWSGIATRLNRYHETATLRRNRLLFTPFWHLGWPWKKPRHLRLCDQHIATIAATQLLRDLRDIDIKALTDLAKTTGNEFLDTVDELEFIAAFEQWQQASQKLEDLKSQISDLRTAWGNNSEPARLAHNAVIGLTPAKKK